MRILIIHNLYQQQGGEDFVFEEESKLLSETEEVKTLLFRNLSGWRGAVQFFFSFWNVVAAARIKKQIRLFHPDIIHVHNWHFAIGPILARTAYKKRVPLVCTLHNFRLLCPSSILWNNGHLFLDSLTTDFPWKAVRKRVYRHSLALTFWLAFVNWFHKKAGTLNLVSRMIVLTESARVLFLSSSLGLEAAKYRVKPNFIADPGLREADRQNYFLFVGRLSEEKGVRVLLETFKTSKFQLRIIGDGPLRQEVIDASLVKNNIAYLGLLPRSEVQAMMSQCTALIFPSVWYEGMPLTLIEALAEGTPVIASDIGAMSSMIEEGVNGIHFLTGDSTDLVQKLNHWMTLSISSRNQFSRDARISYLDNYTPQKNNIQLLNIYEESILQQPISRKLP